MPVFGITANSAAATSPSEMKRMLAPTSRRFWTACSWRGRSSMTTVTSPGSPPFASASLRITSSSGSSRLISSAARGPAAIFSM